MASGNGRLGSSTKTDTVDRAFNQLSAQVLYRFLADEQVYVGFRYNTVTGRLFGYSDDDGDHQHGVGRVDFPGLGHLALAQMKLREMPVQRPGFSLEFVASAHGGISSDAIYSSLYSINRVHKNDLVLRQSGLAGVRFLVGFWSIFPVDRSSRGF